MCITTLSINVGQSRANRSLVMDVFSFVDLLFIVDPPHKADEGGVVHEDVDFDLFSFVQASSVEVFVRSSLSDLFLVDLHDLVTCVIMYDMGGVRRRIGGVYIPPKMDRLEWSDCEPTWDDCDLLMGDFNAQHEEGTRTRGLAGCVFLIVMACGCPSFAIGMACECTLQWGVRSAILAPLICLSGNRQQGFHMMGRLALNMSPLSRGLK